jgi:hypothetical protein
MGGGHSRRSSPPRPIYHYYDIDIPQDANRQINNIDKKLSNNNNIKSDLQKKIKSKTDETVADSITKTSLDKQIESKIKIRNQLNQSISDIMASRETTDELIVKTEGFVEGVEGSDSKESRDANNSLMNAVASMQNYYSSLINQNNVLTTTISKYSSEVATNDRKFIKKETKTDFYLLLNYYLFIFYYVFLALLVYVYFFVQKKMNLYKKIAIVVALALFPFISLYLVQFLYYIYNVCYAFFFAVPYVPSTIV